MGYSDNWDNLGKVAHDAWQVEGKQGTSLAFPFLRLSNSIFFWGGHHSLINIYFLEGGGIEVRWLEKDREIFWHWFGCMFPPKIWVCEWQLGSQERALTLLLHLRFIFLTRLRGKWRRLYVAKSLPEIQYLRWLVPLFWNELHQDLAHPLNWRKYSISLSGLYIAKWTVHPSCGKKQHCLFILPGLRVRRCRCNFSIQSPLSFFVSFWLNAQAFRSVRFAPGDPWELPSSF